MTGTYTSVTKLNISFHFVLFALTVFKHETLYDKPEPE